MSRFKIKSFKGYRPRHWRRSKVKDLDIGGDCFLILFLPSPCRLLVHSSLGYSYIRPGHKCNGHMYSLEIVAYEKEGNNVDCEIFEQENMCEEEIMPQVSLNAMTGWMQGKHVSSSLNQMGVEISNMALCVCPATLMHMNGSSKKPNSNIQTLFQDFSTVFDTPKDLPPIRSHDHIIPLLPNTPPISVRPYKHPPNQKDAIELMVKELLEAGVIENSQSSFSSPIVMVKKKDGTWRMCVDYRMLNTYTVKDKFPIPIIEELLDELYGAKSLMNIVFKPYLRKFVLVFFDDILVYSKSEEEHWNHLKTILQTMQQHTLFAKESKCTFAARQVEYLGHIITEEGVSTDPTKIQAMESWPIP
nr:reverse transcriptase [Tanacetum cinerariifolium]